MCGRLSTGKIAAMHNENLHSILFSCEDMLGQDTLWHASHIKLYSDIYIYADPLLILRCLFQKSPKEIVGQAAETTWYRQRPQHSLPLAHRTNEKRTLAVGIGTASKISTVDRTQSTLATHWQHTGKSGTDWEIPGYHGATWEPSWHIWLVEELFVQTLSACWTRDISVANIASGRSGRFSLGVQPVDLY